MKFVCGVHGVGKTIFAKELSREMSLKYYAASNLIKNRTNKELCHYKKVQCIANNQTLLLEALAEIKETQYILDGHLCLINGKNKIERISYKVFQKMNIDFIYVVVEQPEIIQNQLKKRDNQIWDLNMITVFQQEELKYAKKIAVDKKIPLKIIYQNKEIMEWPIEEDKNIILSIRPIFAEKILSGEKKYEYRKRLCAKKVSKIYIYETAPVKKIIGEVEVIKKLKMKKEKLWKQTQKFSGISKEFYGKYFEKQEYACAYELGESKKYSDPVTLESIGVNYIPQSFAYYDGIITSTSSDTQTD